MLEKHTCCRNLLQKLAVGSQGMHWYSGCQEVWRGRQQHLVPSLAWSHRTRHHLSSLRVFHPSGAQLFAWPVPTPSSDHHTDSHLEKTSLIPTAPSPSHSVHTELFFSESYALHSLIIHFCCDLFTGFLPTKPVSPQHDNEDQAYDLFFIPQLYIQYLEHAWHMVDSQQTLVFLPQEFIITREVIINLKGHGKYTAKLSSINSKQSFQKIQLMACIPLISEDRVNMAEGITTLSWVRSQLDGKVGQLAAAPSCLPLSSSHPQPRPALQMLFPLLVC